MCCYYSSQLPERSRKLTDSLDIKCFGLAGSWREIISNIVMSKIKPVRRVWQKYWKANRLGEFLAANPDFMISENLEKISFRFLLTFLVRQVI